MPPSNAAEEHERQHDHNQQHDWHNDPDQKATLEYWMIGDRKSLGRSIPASKLLDYRISIYQPSPTTPARVSQFT